jgi:hypothetical protein
VRSATPVPEPSEPFGSRRALDGRREILAWWAASRAIVLGSALLVQGLGWPRPHWRRSILTEPLSVLASWDGRWYRIVAERGYLLVSGRQSDPAFFPLLPIVERTFHAVGLPLQVAGIAAANGFFLVGLLALYALGRELLPERDARRAAVYAAIFPLGFVFSMAYPEALVLAAAALAGLWALRGRWLACAGCAAAAALSRPEGVFVALPIAAVVLRRWPSVSLTERARATTAALAAPLALASFAAFLWWAVGNPFAWSAAEATWGRAFSPTGVVRALRALPTAMEHGHDHWIYEDATFCALYLAVLLLALRARVPRAWVVTGALIVLLPLESGSLISDARYGLVALPVFWGLAIAGRRTWLDRLVRVVAPALLGAAVFTIPTHFP